MAVYLDISTYIGCSQDIKDKIARIDAIIELLEDSELKGAGKAHIEEYKLNDGQTRIETVFRDPSAIEKAILALERRRNRLKNQCAGYRYGLIDGNVKI